MPNSTIDSPNQGCLVTHSRVSRPSSRSWRNGSKVPPEPNVPRVLWISTWNPRSASGLTIGPAAMPALP